MIKINGLNFKYENAKVNTLDDVSFTLDHGKVLAVVGPSGGGKSTLLRLISGLEAPKSGQIIVNDKDITTVKPEKRGIGMLFQDYALFPHMTVEKNILYGVSGSSKNKKNVLNKMLALINMTGYEKRYPFELSGGQQQRIALVRALAPEPDILLLDEPFSNLDTELLSKIREEMFKIIESLGITTIMVTHNKEDATLFADQIIRIETGKIKS